MADIFARAGNDFRGAFSADAARVVFAGQGLASDAGGVGLLTQNLSVNYAQQITRLYEIGTNATYLVAGRTFGNIGLGRVLGPRSVQLAFYTRYGNVCNAAQNNFNLEMDAACTNAPNAGGAAVGQGSGNYRFAIRNSVITNIGIAIAAADMLVNEQLQMMFVSLDMG
jgi:hypothetical protein